MLYPARAEGLVNMINLSKYRGKSYAFVVLSDSDVVFLGEEED